MNKFIDFIKKLEIWFFYGFLATFTLSIRKVLFFSPIKGQFNEYTGIYFYFSDLFIFLMLFCWGISILSNKYNNLSIYKWLLLAFIKQKMIIVPSLFVIFCLFSILWSTNQWVSSFRFLKLLEFYFLYLWVIFRIFPFVNCSALFPLQENVSRLPRSDKLFHVKQFICYRGGTLIYNFLLILITTGIFQSIIGIWQFLIQKSVGLFWLKESLVLPNLAGVAKIILNGDKYIRSYGLFPHPNILGGFLVMSILINLLMIKFYKNGSFEGIFFNKKEMFHPSTNVPPQYKCSTWNILRGRRGTFYGAGAEHFTGQAWKLIKKIIGAVCSWLGSENFLNYYFRIALFVQSFGLILTFSKSAIIGLVLGVLMLNFYFKDKIWKDFHESRENRKISARFFIFLEKFKFVTFFLVFFVLAIFILKPNFNSYLGESVGERLNQINVSRGTFIENPILGLGIGQYVFDLLKNYQWENWQYQPVHNVFLLIINETGTIGFLIFLVFIVVIFEECKILKFNNEELENNEDKNENDYLNNRLYFYLKSIFVAFLFIMLFDHYFWDIQQGQILLWLVLGLLAGGKMWTTKEFNTYPQDKIENIDK